MFLYLPCSRLAYEVYFAAIDFFIRLEFLFLLQKYLISEDSYILKENNML